MTRVTLGTFFVVVQKTLRTYYLLAGTPDEVPRSKEEEEEQQEINWFLD